MKTYTSPLEGEDRRILTDIIGFLRSGKQTTVDAVREVYRVSRRALAIASDAYILFYQEGKSRAA